MLSIFDGGKGEGEARGEALSFPSAQHQCISGRYEKHASCAGEAEAVADRREMAKALLVDGRSVRAVSADLKVSANEITCNNT